MARKWIFVIFIIALCLLLSSCGGREQQMRTFPEELQRSHFNENEHSIQPQQSIHSEPKTPSLNQKNKYEKNQKSKQYSKSKPSPVQVKGIYVSGWIAGSKEMDELIEMIERTELNAVVIDVKNDSGEVTYDSKVKQVDTLQADRKIMIPQMEKLLQKLKEKNIYTIARIVAFKDPYFAGKKPSIAMKHKNGNTWKDSKGVAWVDPYQPEVMQYNLDIAKEAATLGFDEIQFDYVRFPDNGKKVDQEVKFYNQHHATKAEQISNFLKKAKNQLESLGVYVSADVFGLTTSSQDDMGIGQDWKLISQQVDYICPMIYPSHYSTGNYNINHPDLNPYDIVHHALKDAIEKNEELKKQHQSTAIIRPWLQSFTAKWLHPHLKYDQEQVQKQIKAAQNLGIEEYLLWNSKCKYPL